MVHVRDAGPDDYADVGELTVAAYLADSVVPPSSPYLDELRDAASRAELADLLVAEAADGTLVGTVTWCRAGTEYAEIAREDEAEFRMLAVDPAARGRGVGEALVRACIARSHTAGAGALVLCTTTREGPATRLYGRLGFRRDAGRDWEPRPGLQLYAYALRLHVQGDALEPLRRCPECGRRMVVQVTPRSWTARCSRHGEVASG